MRKHFSGYIEQIAAANDDIVFVTGDLGYAAFENLAEKMGDRFINAGVAEQNMVGVAAGMASQGFRVICYSIAPFVVYRCLEQVRNDVCLHNLPVYLVGNGGGYGYGIMGSSHHAIEDIAALAGLPNMHCYLPAFVEDMHATMATMLQNRRPAYLRLGLGKNMPPMLAAKAYGTASPELHGARLTAIAQGPVANNLLAAINNNGYAGQTEVFTLNQMPLASLPIEVMESIARTRKVLVVEEHIATGGLGSAIAMRMAEEGLQLDKFVSLRAEGYPNGLYGSQGYHQQISGLDEANIADVIKSFLH